MTRVTDFGRKRTYLQAGFANDVDEHPAGGSASAKTSKTSETTYEANNPDLNASAPPTKKKRKRTPKSKRDGYAALRAAEAAARGEVGDTEGGEAEAVKDLQSQSSASASTTTPKPGISKSLKKKKRNQERREKILSATEARRLKRTKEKTAETTCFACREKGHAARDCPSAGGVLEGEKKLVSVGICYRCGSKKHSLSRCKKPNNPADPFPFASCFVCNGTGHLASSCPQNKAKGVYPNGGCCKLCGDTSHLARDCGVRQKVTDPTALLGTGHTAGADEDDFHTFKRTTTELDRTEKELEKRKKIVDVMSGALSGKVVQTGNIPAPVKKVVVFK